MRRYIILTIPILLFSCDIGKFFQQKFYKDSYKPNYIENIAHNQEINPSFFIKDLNCISYKNAYCQTASLQMVDKSNLSSNVNHYNWISGFTYGAYFEGSFYSFIPYNDPELGFIQAENEIGLRRKYYVSEDSILFLDFLKSNISMNKPVRVAINSAVFANKPWFFPHSILIVGYEPDSIIYYETGGQDRNIKNYKGEKVNSLIMLKAIRSIGEKFRYPWKYNMSIFETINKSPNFKKVLISNAKSLKGIKFGPISTGSKAIESLALLLETDKEIPNDHWSWNKYRFESGAYTRIDNALFIESEFSNNPNILKAAEKLRLSGKQFEKICTMIDKQDINKLEFSRLLKISSQSEMEASEILVAEGEK